MKLLIASMLITVLCSAAYATVQIAAGGKAKCVILTQPGATDAELHAANELAKALQQVTGAEIPIMAATGEAPPTSCIVVGPGPVAAHLFSGVPLATFGDEQLTIRTSGGRLLLAGGRPRGTLYAVYRFLQTQCGVRWWTPWASRS